MGLAPTSLPGGLTDLDSTAWNRPTAFVGRLQDQQSALATTYERTGGSGDGRDEGRQIGSFTSVAVAHEITLGGSGRQRLSRQSCATINAEGGCPDPSATDQGETALGRAHHLALCGESVVGCTTDPLAVPGVYYG